MSRQKSGIALITVIVFILLLSIIAVATLALMTNKAVLTESYVKRIQGQYAAEAAIQKNLMNYALGVLVPPLPPQEETPIDVDGPGPGGPINPVTVDYIDDNAGPGGTDTLKATYSY